jgi:hypothetical protein
MKSRRECCIGADSRCARFGKPALHRRSAIAGIVAGARARRWAMLPKHDAAICMPCRPGRRAGAKALARRQFQQATFDGKLRPFGCAIVQMRKGRAALWNVTQ